MPGCLADATDRAQISELVTLGELTQRAWDAGVQVMIEGPGHVPLNQVVTNMQIQKRLCHNAPFYVLGPAGHRRGRGLGPCGLRHRRGPWPPPSGADFLCYVTPTEHLALPGPQ